VAVFAMSAVVAASASAALPEFYNCVKQTTKTFEYTESKCETKKAKEGEFEKVPFTIRCEEKAGGRGEYATKAECENPAGKETAGGKWKRFGGGFTSKGKAGETYLLETVGGHKVQCKSLENKGELTGPKTDIVTVTFDECTTEGFKCQSAGAKEGEIVVKNARSKLVYIKHEVTKQVGIALEPAVAGGLFVEFKCNTPIIKETIKVKGSVIGVIEPINTWVVPPAEFTLTFSQAAGVQKPTEYEEEVGGVWKKVPDFLETKGEGLIAFGYEQSGESAIDKLLLEEAAEIRA